MSPYLIKPQVMKAHVGVDAQLHDFLTSTIELKGYLYNTDANSRYLLGTCVVHCPSGCLDGEKTSESYQESNPDFFIFLSAAYSQSKNDLPYEVMDKTENVATNDGNRRFLYSQNVRRGCCDFSFDIWRTFCCLKWPVI